MDLIGAVEDNLAELLMRMGAAGGGVQRDDGRARWTIGGSPLDYHNAVVAVDLAGADAAIAESLALMRERNVPGSWHVGPSLRPDELGPKLLSAGFEDGGSEPAMALALDELTQEPLGPAGLEIREVESEDELVVWAETLARGFGEGKLEADWVSEIYRREGFGDPWAHYLARLDGEPVATATIFRTGDVAGVYFVMTVPEARRQGIGAAITRHAVRGSNAQYAVLGASSAGKPVYERLGFRTVGEIRIYEFH
ncbi:GNAT family N-acetyltransferase [Kribbella sp. NPDC051770]|uniref:GNAT family N-acetyltransferase n=1 Tax=Kribbella sp. NPDC051770 TaxID=3155413 RepID=UPI00341A2871